jgi:choline dehydrogenase-like flavoprotein
VQVQLYSYRSLLTFKLFKELRLPYREAMRLIPHLVPLLGVLLFNFEDSPAPSKYCVLRRTGSGDQTREWLEIQYRSSTEEQRTQRIWERQTLALLRMLGCWPLRRIPLQPGASIHYAGTFPMTRNGRDLTCDPECRLVGTSSVYLADGSVFSSLPAKGLTFTMMANASRVGTSVAKQLGRVAASA